MTAQTEKEMEAIRHDLADLRKDVRSLLEAMGSNGTHRLHELRERIVDRLKRPAEQVRQSVEQARDYGRQAVDQTRQTVTEHPLSTVLAAAGIGALLGLALGRRA